MIPYTTIPFMSAFFLVLVGVLVGKLVWYRTRDEHEQVIYQLRKKLRSLENKSKQDSEELAKARFDAVQATNQWTESVSQVNELTSAIERAQSKANATELQLNEERQARTALQVCLDDESTQRKQVENKLAQLQREYDLLHDAHQQLAGEHAGVCADLQSLDARLSERDTNFQAIADRQSEWQAEQKRWGLERHQMKLLAEQLHRQIDEQQALLDESRADLESSQTRHQELEAELLAAKAQLDLQSEEHLHAVEAATEELRRSLQKQAELTSQLTTAETQVAAAEQALQQIQSQQYVGVEIHDALQATLQQKEMELAALQHELNEHHRSQSRVIQELEAAEKNRARFEQLVRSQHDQIIDLKNEADRFTRQLVDALRDRESLSRQVSRLEEQLQEADSRQINFETMLQRNASQAQRIESLEAEIQEREERLNQASKERSSTDDLLQQHREEIRALEQKIDEQFADLEQAAQQLENERQRRQSLDDSLRSSREKLGIVRNELERLEQVEDQLVELEASHRQLRSELKDVRQQRDAVAESESATRVIVEQLRDELTERLDEVELLRRDRQTAVGQLELERRQRNQLQDALQQTEHRVSALSSENSALVRNQTQLTTQVSELNEQLAEIGLAMQSLRQELADTAQERDEVLQHIEASQRETRKEQRKRFSKMESREAERGRAGFSFRGIKSREESLREADEAKLIRDPDLGWVYREPPHRRDDLKKIPGIADREEQMLHKLGVYCYRQMMEWSEATTQLVAIRLGFKHENPCGDWPAVARQRFHQIDRSAA